MTEDPRSTAELQQLALETEAVLRQVREELERRQQAKQHFAVDHLQEHMSRATLSVSALRSFFEMLLDELRADSKPPADTDDAP